MVNPAYVIFCADITRLLQYFNNIGDRFRNILAILKYLLNISVLLCEMPLKKSTIVITIIIKIIDRCLSCFVLDRHPRICTTHAKRCGCTRTHTYIIVHHRCRTVCIYDRVERAIERKEERRVLTVNAMTCFRYTAMRRFNEIKPRGFSYAENTIGVARVSRILLNIEKYI